MFTVDVFSICQSLSQSVMSVTLFTIWFMTQEYSFLRIFFYKNRIYALLVAYLLILYFLGVKLSSPIKELCLSYIANFLSVFCTFIYLSLF